MTVCVGRCVGYIVFDLFIILCSIRNIVVGIRQRDKPEPRAATLEAHAQAQAGLRADRAGGDARQR